MASCIRRVVSMVANLSSIDCVAMLPGLVGPGLLVVGLVGPGLVDFGLVVNEVTVEPGLRVGSVGSIASSAESFSSEGCLW